MEKNRRLVPIKNIGLYSPLLIAIAIWRGEGLLIAIGLLLGPSRCQPCSQRAYAFPWVSHAWPRKHAALTRQSTGNPQEGTIARATELVHLILIGYNYTYELM